MTKKKPNTSMTSTGLTPSLQIMLPVCVQAMMSQEGILSIVDFLCKTHSPSLMVWGENLTNSNSGICKISGQDTVHCQAHQKREKPEKL